MVQMVAVKAATKLVALKEIAKIIRSKNAGPFEITMDIIFKSVEEYEAVKVQASLQKNSLPSYTPFP